MICVIGAMTATIAVIGCVNAHESTGAQTERTGRTAATSSELADAAAGGRQPAPQRQSAAPIEARDVCALLAAKDVTELTGVAIERAEKKPNGCEWYGNSAAQRRKGADTARTTFEKLTKDEPKSADEGVRTMENLLKGLGGAAAPTKPLFAATVHWEDGDQAETMFKGMVAVNGAGQPGGALEAVEGLGDRGFIGAMGTLFFVRKGAALILFGAMGITREQEIALARKLVSKL
jgi:hypothetical protein